MTPLHKTAQEAIEMIATEDLSKWASRHDKVTIDALKSAINAEQAQEAEPALSEILAEKGIKLRTAFEEKPRDHARGAGKMINEPYDQQAMELCDACGWKAIMPGEPCFVCNMQTEAQQVAVPDGYALVPIEPTPAILDAMSSSGWKTASYKAMLAAAQGAKP